MSDHETNWVALKAPLGQAFTVYAMDRRGRGETTAPHERSLEEEFGDIVALIEAVGLPTFVLGHSFGAHCAMGGAALRPELVRKLVLYEPPVPNGIPSESLAHAEEAAARGDWEGFVRTFLLEGPKIPAPMVEALASSPFWAPMVADAPATLADVRTLGRYHFDPARFAILSMSVLLLVGSESPRLNYVTDALAGVLPESPDRRVPGPGPRCAGNGAPSVRRDGLEVSSQLGIVQGGMLTNPAKIMKSEGHRTKPVIDSQQAKGGGSE